MKLNTKHFGLLEVNNELIIKFPNGIPGFEDVREFFVIEQEDKDIPFKWLQSVDCPDLAFVIVDPREVREDYILDIDDEQVKELHIENPDNVVFYSIVVIYDEQLSINLKAPILINTENSTGKQVILDNDDYPIKFFMFRENKELEVQANVGVNTKD